MEHLQSINSIFLATRKTPDASVLANLKYRFSGREKGRGGSRVSDAKGKISWLYLSFIAF